MHYGEMTDEDRAQSFSDESRSTYKELRRVEEENEILTKILAQLEAAGEWDKRHVFKWMFNALSGVMENWNGLAVEEGERGRNNEMLCLVIAEDGSGQVGTVHKVPDEVNPQEGAFSSIDDWASFFDKWIDETEWTDAMPDTGGDDGSQTV